MRRGRAAVTGVLAAAVVLAGCGGGSKEAATTTTSTTAAPTTTTTAPAEQDKAVAQSIAITQADVLPAYKPAEDSEPEVPDETDDAHRRCAQANPFLSSSDRSRLVQTAFGTPQFSAVHSQVELGPVEKDVAEAFGVILSDRFPDCMAEASAATLRNDAEGDGVTLDESIAERKPVAVTGINEATQINFRFTAKVSGRQFRLFQNHVYLRKGRVAVLLAVSALNKEVDQAEVTRLTELLAKRLAEKAPTT